MIQIKQSGSSPHPQNDFIQMHFDTAVGLDLGEVLGSEGCIEVQERGALMPLLHLWNAAIELGRFSFHGWEAETLAGWTGQPGALLNLLRRTGFLVPFGELGRFRLAGTITESTRVATGLSDAMASVEAVAYRLPEAGTMCAAWRCS